MNTTGIGNYGETAACKYLLDKGYKIIERNYNCKIAEIDIVAYDSKNKRTNTNHANQEHDNNQNPVLHRQFVAISVRKPLINSNFDESKANDQCQENYNCADPHNRSHKGWDYVLVVMKDICGHPKRCRHTANYAKQQA